MMSGASRRPDDPPVSQAQSPADDEVTDQRILSTTRGRLELDGASSAQLVVCVRNCACTRTCARARACQSVRARAPVTRVSHRVPPMIRAFQRPGDDGARGGGEGKGGEGGEDEGERLAERHAQKGEKVVEAEEELDKR